MRTESVERALSILMAFTGQTPRMTLAELAEETGLHKSTIIRLTNSMNIYGFINKGEDGRYSIGASVWRLGLIFSQDFSNRDEIQPVLEQLVEATGETASFYVRAGNERVCLFRENSPNLIRFHLEEGMRLPLETGASGLILRHYSGDDVEDTTPIQPSGTVEMVGQRNPHIASIATPVFNGAGDLQGALSVSGLKTRFDEEARAKAIPLLEACAGTLRK